MNSVWINKVWQSGLEVTIFFLLLIQISDLFRMPLLLGVSLTLVAAITLMVTSAYMALNVKYVQLLFDSFLTKLIFTLKLGLPIVLSVIHILQGYLTVSGFIRPLLLSVMLFNFFIVTAIIALKWRMKSLRVLIGSIVTVVLTGLIFNYLYPQLFYALRLAVWGISSDLQTLEASEIERTAGFYLKSTAASASMLLLFPAIAAVIGRRISLLAFSYLVLVVAVFFTGSRSGIVITGILAPFSLLVLFRFANTNMRLKKKDSIRFGVILIPLLLLFGGIVGGVVLQSVEKFNVSGLTDRLESLVSVDRLKTDESLSLRKQAQLKYLSFVKENPLVGYGPMYSSIMKKKGKLWLSSHNSYIENAFDFGLVFIFVYILFIVTLLLGTSDSVRFSLSFIDMMSLLGFIILVLSLFVSSILDNRSLFFTLGVLTGLASRCKMHTALNLG